MERKFYGKVTSSKIKKAIQEIAEEEKGFYRIEQSTADHEDAANINRIWDMGQYISSVYSSSYHVDYQEFQRKTFMLEQPYRNILMQPAAKNPLYQQFMGVKYIVSDGDVPGYQKYKTLHGQNIYKREDVLPLAYASDRVISEKAYQKLEFPYNQIVLSEYAVAQDGEEKWDRIEETDWQLRPVEIELPESKEEKFSLEKTEIGYHTGYHIQTADRKDLSVELPELGDADTLFVQFSVMNHKKTQDVSVWLAGIQNKLTANSHIYYNENERFTYALKLEDGAKTIELGLDAGDYDLYGFQCFAGHLAGGTEKLCQSEFQPDWERTKGNRIAGSVTAKNDGYLITSIPFDENFEMKVDGKNVEAKRVNTAFLGIKIEAGEHQIEMLYHAPGLTMGKCLSLIGILLFLLQFGLYYMETSRKALAKA